jgi:putative transposase
MSLQGSLSVERMCELARVSRASFYRSLREHQPGEEEMEVRSAIQQIAVEHRRRYGYRRISEELHRRGMQVNHKRVLRMMRKDNLLAVRRRRFLVTTDSNHSWEVYLNLVSRPASSLNKWGRHISVKGFAFNRNYAISREDLFNIFLERDTSSSLKN